MGNQHYLAGHKAELALAGDLARGLELGEQEKSMMHHLIVHPKASQSRFETTPPTSRCSAA